MKVALVHDYINQWGGAEQVLLAMHELFPEAPIFTLFFEKEKKDSEIYTQLMQRFDDLAQQEQLRTSGIQRLPRWLRESRVFMPIYPTAVEMFDMTDYDLVISDSSAFSKGVITRPDAIHICYCHTPTRYLWDWHDRYLQEQQLGWFKKLFVVPLLSYLRIWDRWAADRVDQFIANSDNVQARIRKFYGQESIVIYPPVDVLARQDKIPKTVVKREIKRIYDGSEKDENYYLVVSRLSAYKNVQLAVDACNRLQVPLTIVGTGREEDELKYQAWGTVRFVGQLSQEKLEEHYRRCKALIMPGVEDFGMVMVEAMSFGKPVIALQAGGALEIVRPGVNGEFFAHEKTRSLMDTLRTFESKWEQGGYQPRDVYTSVERFDRHYFKQQIRELVDQLLKH